MIRIKSDQLKQIMKELLLAAGVSPENSELTAEILLQADMRGINTHGALRLPVYLKRIAAGSVAANPEMKVTLDRKAVAVIDGGHGLGQISGHKAMKLAIEKAGNCGIGSVWVVNGHHFGAGAYYTALAAEADMIGFAVSNTVPLMAPWGGREARVGNNPMAVCIPAGKEPPILLDMAFSQVAQGKISLAMAKGEKIPLDWAIDKEGSPTDDPTAAMEGLLLPAGGYKGYGQAVIADLLSGILQGAGIGGQVKAMRCLDQRQNSGQMYLAIDISAFQDPAEFKVKVDEYIRWMKKTPGAQGTEEIFLPGQQSWARLEESRVRGIRLPEAVFDELIQEGDKLGIDIRPLIPPPEASLQGME